MKRSGRAAATWDAATLPPRPMVSGSVSPRYDNRSLRAVPGRSRGIEE